MGIFRPAAMVAALFLACCPFRASASVAETAQASANAESAAGAAASTVSAQSKSAHDVTLPPVVFLYHKDRGVRARTIEAYAAKGDPALADDLVRAYGVATGSWGDFRNALRGAAGNAARHPSTAKAWLEAEVAAGRLTVDYLPLDFEKVDPKDRDRIDPLIAKAGPEHLEEMVAGVRSLDADNMVLALRYMILNDHLPQVREFMTSDWMADVLSHELTDRQIYPLPFALGYLADPGPLRDSIVVQLGDCLASGDRVKVMNALRVIAGPEGHRGIWFNARELAGRVHEIERGDDTALAGEARRALRIVDPSWRPPESRAASTTPVTYEEAFSDLYLTLGRQYPCFELKGIDWRAVGDDLLPRAKEVETDEEFGLLCMELVAKLEDSHAGLLAGTLKPPGVDFPQWDPGFACLIDDRGRPVVYYVDLNGPAHRGGVRPGMTVVSMNGKDAMGALDEIMQRTRRYVGYSSDRYLRYHAAQWLGRRTNEGAEVAVMLEDTEGRTRELELPATLGVRYLPRLPIPIEGIRDSADVAWRMLDDGIGYIYVRRIRGNLIANLDSAVGELKDAKGIIVDVRGNSGGGFDSSRSHRNFDRDDPGEPGRPRFAGPIAMLVDARCISAGEGWASWFVANKRARLFGEATAGASSRKTVYTLKNGLYKVRFPVKAYKGFLDRPIERRGLEPDVPLRQNAADLAAGRDTVLEAARAYLVNAAGETAGERAGPAETDGSDEVRDSGQETSEVTGV
ncbi:MAG: S41 family peptidase, partial [Planctomycetota bacterium]